ncbi:MULTISPECIES: mannose-1-phosphate guanylyltransferase/mannose-6-phosphate isomerase [Acinetobacter]|jgi:mannose-1-phosphate guanylyltransferase/mannose-1-phosphate guanylyltransferase/mannose-6-phosphate isomerase|uniref:mannose-1-phosphate guanylyltransferase/mannose-6-phosphate isomerase n=1 Tax=Acinetobacter TaxID=469 RepID=UPI000950B097|nr:MULTISPECIES: mannose-1-phosphate guanylyltransferase/mannose-6-phosphate isomerase [Acinetobacter]APU49651.1 mannose-1-phosphate guanylyltransferase/mannose-6-phosphate isomerase [Acinetobacter junii]MBF4456757.1 mannose-1-phosphate guanylyltransferase/mannose-6-phosphate isomerase [Acinetobacter sp. SK-43]MDH1690515.1 mannose-1-phosphate guanylyltransferase/mannose-6-phosphate isomerase [Acinetobacter junii]MDI9719835.1 mannose-1-phosphate guanylyltransferase/mannose-6-phosphate isomerase 
MAGGSGTRLWPLSRTQFPKQFLKLGLDGYTLLQSTILRLKNLDCDDPILICNEEHRFLAAEQMREIGVNARIILEPVGKNTAPAIALAAILLRQKQENKLMLVLAADHAISEQTAFENSIKDAIDLASQNKLVTFGIVPTHVETGYGYIEKGTPIEHGFNIDKFVEKPDQATAQAYLESQRFLWNSGMFMFEAEQYLEELKKYASDIFQACNLSMQNICLDIDFIRIDQMEFEKCRSESIDYAVMERTAHAVVIPLEAGWSDVGSWSALWDIKPKDHNGNVTDGDVLLHHSQNNYCYSESRLVSLLGVENLVVVETKDAVLVADKNKVQDIKKIVEQLKNDDRSEYYRHREVYRPWGKYDSIDQSSRYQVKRITVKPGQKLSIQMHYHRSEHWIVVSGTAKIHKGTESFLLTENESVYIPLGEIHALENPGKLPLELIEVQSGSYLGEDDIVRFDDLYGRT